MHSAFAARYRETLDRFGRRRAIVHAADGRDITFDGLETAARGLAATPAFARLAGRIALLRLPNSIEWIVSLLALRHAGAVIALADAETPDAALRDLAQQLRAGAILDTDGLASTGLRRAPFPPEVFLGKITSGSTGAPRAHLFTENEMLADGDTARAAMGLGPDDLSHAGLPFGHAYALGYGIMPLLTHGVPISVASSHFPGVVAAEIAARRATVWPTIPTIIAGLNRSDIAPGQLASLRMIVTAGARMDPAEARAFAEKFNRRIHNLYGSSETGGVAFDTTGDDTLTGAAAGRLLPGVSATRMRDGRLLVSGPSVRTLGNRRRVAGEGAQAMADLGRVDATGRILLEGRMTAFVKVAGRRISPAEVERELVTLPGVREAFVATLPGPGGELRLAALVTGDPGDTRALRSALRARLPAWKIPSRITLVPEFPRTARGKSDRSAMLLLLEKS